MKIQISKKKTTKKSRKKSKQYYFMIINITIDWYLRSRSFGRFCCLLAPMRSPFLKKRGKKSEKKNHKMNFLFECFISVKSFQYFRDEIVLFSEKKICLTAIVVLLKWANILKTGKQTEKKTHFQKSFFSCIFSVVFFIEFFHFYFFITFDRGVSSRAPDWLRQRERK